MKKTKLSCIIDWERYYGNVDLFREKILGDIETQHPAIKMALEIYLEEGVL